VIKLLKKGDYKLIETQGHTKILNLGGKNYAWINASGIGEILVSSYRPFKTDHILALGKFRIYDVQDEDSLTDLWHLELYVGLGEWQGYLLTTGLPTSRNIRKRIIPTSELITKSII
jgi:hypothetical protein